DLHQPVSSPDMHRRAGVVVGPGSTASASTSDGPLVSATVDHEAIDDHDVDDEDDPSPGLDVVRDRQVSTAVDDIVEVVGVRQGHQPVDHIECAGDDEKNAGKGVPARGLRRFGSAVHVWLLAPSDCDVTLEMATGGGIARMG